MSIRAWSATSSMKVSGTLVTRDMPCRGCRHIHGIGANAAEGNHLALLQSVDNPFADGTPLGNDGIGMAGGSDKFLLSCRFDFDKPTVRDAIASISRL